MKPSQRNLHRWGLCCVLRLITLSYARMDWPPSNPSDPQLLGLFYNISNVTGPTTWSYQARAMFQSAILLARRQNVTLQGRLIGWHAVQTGGQSMTALGSTCERMAKSDVVGIVGPPLSQEAHVLATFAQVIGIPVISYASTDPALSDSNAYPTFYRTVPSDNTAAQAIAQLFVRFNWTSAIVIYQNDAYGLGGAKVIDETFSRMKLTVIETVVFDIMTLAVRGNLKNLLTSSSSRIVVLWMQSNYARYVLDAALRADVLGPHFTWIHSCEIALASFNTTSAYKLAGMLTVEPVVGSAVGASINTTLLNAAYDLWKQYEPETFPGADSVDDYALFTFDATWMLIRALAALCSPSSNVSSSCLSFTGDSFCFNRRFVNRDTLIDILHHTSFRGVTGPMEFNSSTTDRLDGSYYVARNIQLSSSGLYYTSALVWSTSGGWTRNARTNAIIWPDGSLKVPSGYSSLSGVTMRIAVIGVVPFTIKTEVTDESGGMSTKLIGYIPELIAQLRNQMDFVPEITFYSSNQSYNDLVNAVANGTFDMFIGDVTVTASRREKVGFSSTIFDNSLRVIVREAVDPELNLWAFLKPFSLQLWLTVLGATVYAGLLMCILESQENEVLQGRSSSSLVGMSMWYAVGTIMGFGADFQATTAAGRLLAVGLYILSLTLFAAYTANLASNLTLLKSTGAISGIDDIKNGKVPFNRVGIVADTSVEDYYLREISDGSRNYYPLRSFDEIFGALVNNTIDASIMDAGTLEYAVGGTYCNLTLVGTDFDRSAYGIVFQKNWLHQQDLDVAILSLRESGMLDTLKVKWFQTNACASSDGVSIAMTIESMAGLFMTFAVINALALLWFTWRKRFVLKAYLLRLFRGRRSSTERDNVLPRDRIEPRTEDAPRSGSSPIPNVYL